MKPKIEYIEVPLSCIQMAERRTKPLTEHYGRNIATMRIELLTASCYLQGVEDAMKIADRRMEQCK